MDTRSVVFGVFLGWFIVACVVAFAIWRVLREIEALEKVATKVEEKSAFRRMHEAGGLDALDPLRDAGMTIHDDTSFLARHDATKAPEIQTTPASSESNEPSAVNVVPGTGA